MTMMEIEPQLLMCSGHSQVIMLYSQVSTYLSQRRHFPNTDHKQDDGNVKIHDFGLKNCFLYISLLVVLSIFCV